MTTKRKKEKWQLKLLHELVYFVDVVPVDDVPEAIHEFGAVILVVNVLCVFPEVENHEQSESGVHVHVVLLNLHYQRSVDALLRY